MKKLLSLLTMSTLTVSIPAPLMAMKSSDDEWEIINKDDIPTANRVKRDVGLTAEDVTTGFDIKIKDIVKEIYADDNVFAKIDNKWYFVVWKEWGQPNWKITKFKNEKGVIEIENHLMKTFQDLNYWRGDKIAKTLYPWKTDPQFFKSVYCWNGIGDPATPNIDINGNITNWNIDVSSFQQGISFALAENDKTATWSNDGMRLTVDGETNINIDNPNVEEVYWDGSLQPQSSKQWKINVKPETTARDHKLVIKYDINGTKYTSEEIMVSMLAKIDPTPTPVQQNLSDLIKNTDLGNIIDNNDDTVVLAVNKANSNIIDDFSQITIEKKDNNKATLKARDDSKSYKGSVDVTYNVVPATVVDLKIELKPTASSTIIDKDYLAQLDSSKMTNKVDAFYYASSESVITMIKPTPSSVITGVVYDCDDKWNKTSQSSIIDATSGIKLDGSQLGAVQGKYLIDLKNELGQTNTIYLQIHSDKDKKAYWNTDNGKQFEMWAYDNGYDNIRGYGASQLNKLFELSKTWKQSLAHLDLKLDNFVVDNIKNVCQDEIDNYKTKLLASVKAQVEKYVPNVVEKTDYVISVDNFVAGDWTTSKDVKVQAVNGSTKLLSFTVKTIPVQQKEQPTPPTPSKKKGGLTGWAIVGIIVGSLAGLVLLGWLFKKFVVDPFILGPIRDKKQKAWRIREDKALAEIQAEEEAEKEKRAK